jgi:hypothetical protein
MKIVRVFTCITLLLITASGNYVSSQRLLNKIKEKTEDKIVNKIFNEDDSKNNNNQQNNGNSQIQTDSGVKVGNSSSSSMSNTKGEGLVTTPPDVNAAIKDAQDAFQAKNYGESRASVRQAIQGIEMEMGQQVLKNLPESVDGLNKDAAQDKVTSTTMGFIGLTIERVYQGSDKELRVTIGNDAAMLSGINMYLNSGYATSNQDPNTKQVKYKGYKAVLTYDESSGYSLSVPFGQSSMFAVHGVNYANEKEIMAAADKFDIEKIKKDLGEK